VTAILQQLGLDSTFYTQLMVFFVLFIFLGQFFFKPFLRLIEERHRRTVQDREAAESMMASAAAKMEEYQAKLHAARVEARGELESVIASAKAEEAKVLTAARDEAKKITQQVSSEIDVERARVRAQLEMDAEALATAISDKLLVRKG
jgi:F-type H+-transporting ATPase subunit b